MQIKLTIVLKLGAIAVLDQTVYRVKTSIAYLQMSSSQVNSKSQVSATKKAEILHLSLLLSTQGKKTSSQMSIVHCDGEFQLADPRQGRNEKSPNEESPNKKSPKLKSRA